MHLPEMAVGHGMTQMVVPTTRLRGNARAKTLRHQHWQGSATCAPSMAIRRGPRNYWTRASSSGARLLTLDRWLTHVPRAGGRQIVATLGVTTTTPGVTRSWLQDECLPLLFRTTAAMSAQLRSAHAPAHGCAMS